MYVLYLVILLQQPSSPPLSLHDALPIWPSTDQGNGVSGGMGGGVLGRQYDPILVEANPSSMDMPRRESDHTEDRKSTRLNSSHTVISYAVFCLKKNKEQKE